MQPFSRRDILAGAAVAILPPPLAWAAGRRQEIILARMTFGPAPKGLQVGDTIVWINRDLFRHTATARDFSFDVDLPPNAEASVVLAHAGMVAVYCRFHPGMNLQLEISE
ncbi:MAG: hypothetical protein HYU58_04860 [Proteobacteria bacterium]|nr:hypothetical protein [Pseudomonadota bacterium]